MAPTLMAARIAFMAGSAVHETPTTHISVMQFYGQNTAANLSQVPPGEIVERQESRVESQNQC